MKKTLLVVLAAWLLLPMNTFAQTYQALWKQVESARDKDLPRQALTHLQKIETKALQEKAYGQLLKAELLTANVQQDISPDSLAPAIMRIEQQAKVTTDEVLRMVYATVLYKVYSLNPSIDNETSDKANHYRQLAMANPDLLAKVKANDYEPLVERGKDSKVFGHDLLSVVGLELDERQWLYDYYMKVGNCPAACIVASRIAKTVEEYDSLIAIFGDYPEAAELAMGRYDKMVDDYTRAERYNWLQKSLERWDTWPTSNYMRNELTDLTTPQFTVSLKRRVQEVEKSQVVSLMNLRNISQLTMRVYRTSLAGDTQLDPGNSNDYKKIKAGLQELPELAQTVTFSGRANYDVFKDYASCILYLVFDSCNRHSPITAFAMWLSMLRQDNPSRMPRYVCRSVRTGMLQKLLKCSPAIAKAKPSILVQRTRQDSLHTALMTISALIRTCTAPTAITSVSTTSNIPTCLPTALSIVPVRPFLLPPSYGKSCLLPRIPPSVASR